MKAGKEDRCVKCKESYPKTVKDEVKLASNNKTIEKTQNENFTKPDMKCYKSMKKTEKKHSTIFSIESLVSTEASKQKLDILPPNYLKRTNPQPFEFSLGYSQSFQRCLFPSIPDIKTSVQPLKNPYYNE